MIQTSQDIPQAGQMISSAHLTFSTLKGWSGSSNNLDVPDIVNASSRVWSNDVYGNEHSKEPICKWTHVSDCIH